MSENRGASPVYIKHIAWLDIAVVFGMIFFSTSYVELSQGVFLHIMPPNLFEKNTRLSYLAFPIISIVIFSTIAIIRRVVFITKNGICIDKKIYEVPIIEFAAFFIKKLVIPLVVVFVFLTQAGEVVNSENKINKDWSVLGNMYSYVFDLLSLWVLSQFVVEIVFVVFSFFYLIYIRNR